ncbi:MAG: phosphatase family protein, partial [Flavisolibacter sp.]|nr:phosphatase family protein [Flavisolibacter sp.]
MKKIFIATSYILVSFVLFIVSCSKDITERTEDIAALNPTNIDLNAGTWKPVLLTGPTEFPVAAPIATTSPDYIAQLAEIKTWQANLTSEEKRIVKY